MHIICLLGLKLSSPVTLTERPSFTLFSLRPEEFLTEQFPSLIPVHAHFTLGNHIAGSGKNLEQEQGIINFLAYLEPARHGFSLQGTHHSTNH